MHLKLNLFFSLFESKTWRETKKNNFSIDQIKKKTVLPIFGKTKKYWTNFNFEFYFGRLFFDVLGRFLQILGHARQKPQIFWNWTHKNIPDRHHSARCLISPKSALSLHPIPHWVSAKQAHRDHKPFLTK